MQCKNSLFSMAVALILILTIQAQAFAADVIDTIEEEDRAEIDAANTDNLAPQLITETIKTISASKKIFILTNENLGYSRGDYISLLVGNQLVCRALVAKLTNTNLSGIKIIKIYNMDLWKQLSHNKEVFVLKGDDSYYNSKDKSSAKKDDPKKDAKIKSEEDLFNSTSIDNPDDDLSFEENSKRLIRPDNVLGLSYDLIQSRDNSGASTRYPHMTLNWAYQLSDNFWGELGAGTNTIRDYPNVNAAGGIDTRLISYNARLKYTFNAPFYSYIMPYVGYQLVTASSPGAGVRDPSINTSDETLAKEKLLVDDLKRSGPIFGVTILRRVVPGWFVRADFGSDLIGGGLSLEF